MTVRVIPRRIVNKRNDFKERVMTYDDNLFVSSTKQINRLREEKKEGSETGKTIQENEGHVGQ